MYHYSKTGIPNITNRLITQEEPNSLFPNTAM